MLEFSQAMLIATLLLSIASFVVYLVAVLTAVTTKKQVKQRQAVLASSAGEQTVTVQDDERTGESPQPSSRRGATWYGAALSVLALVTLTISVILRWIVVQRPPLSNQYEFAVSFIWGMLLFQIIFVGYFRVRTLAVFTLPVIIGIAIYASQLSYAANPLMPALQNSPLLTVHVFSASLAYGAAMVSFGAAVMYLISPKIKWRGWPKPELLDEIAYKATIVTYPLLTMMLVLGAIWGNVAWGRYWGWDPKETSALVTWLIYSGYLHARVVHDWRGAKSCWLLVLGFAAVLFTYFGNHFFGGLHSYG